jgi:DNA-binding PadR family transcriptional regulator
VDAKAWLLAFLAAGPSTRAIPRWPMDPVRIQKGMFLLAQSGPSEARDVYEFEPYNYGPCSFPLYRDLDTLEDQGLIKGTVQPGHTWKEYELTPAGVEQARSAVPGLSEQDLAQVRQIYQFVVSRSFRRLLSDVYQQYPEYAENSVVTELRPK